MLAFIYDPTITLGSLFSAAIVLVVSIAGWVAFRARVDAVLSNQDRLMSHLTERFEAHENRDEEMFQKIQTRLMDLSGGIQRLIGQNEVFRQQQDRRQP